jgi:D-glycero-beta-D-manno-heptose-7-phosphate kinase
LKPRILVLGDACHDIYVYGQVNRLNPESPVPLMSWVSQTQKAGMALNVYQNLCALGADCDLVVPKTISKKTRYVDQRSGQQLLRVDQDTQHQPLVIDNVEGVNCYSAVVVSDYAKGMISRDFLVELDQAAAIPVVVDTKQTDLAAMTNLLFKINQREHQLLTSPPPRLVVTLGAQGAEWNGQLYRSEPVPVYDVCGAGDMFAAVLTWCLALGLTVDHSMPLCNLAASWCVQVPGVHVLTPEQVQLLQSTVAKIQLDSTPNPS